MADENSSTAESLPTAARQGSHHEERGHRHGKIKRFAKVLIAMECPWALYNYYFRYQMGEKGSFYSGFETNLWIYYTRIATFVSTLLGVIVAVITESYFKKYTVLVVGFLMSLVSCFVVFAVCVFDTGPYEQKLNAVGLFWGCLFFAVEPLRVGVFFDQLPAKMTAHQSAHVFLMYQEMKTVGSVGYVVLSKTLAGKVYGKTPLALAVLYFVIPVLYIIVIIGFWKFSNPGVFSYSMGVNCVTCYARAFHLKFIKNVKQEGHWLDVARGVYDSKTVRNAKITASLIFLFTTLVSYGMAQELIKNSWIYQAQSLNENLSHKKIYQDVQMVFFVLTIVLLPFIEYLLLPQIYKRRKNQKPFTELQRVGITMFLTGMAFAMTTILQLQIEKHSSIIPSGSRSQVRLFNVQNHSFVVGGNWVFEPTNISSNSMIQAWNLKSHRTTLYTIEVTSEQQPSSNGTSFTSFMATVQGQSISYLIGVNELLRVHGFDPIVFGPPGTNQNDMVRVYIINYKMADGGTYLDLLQPGDELQILNLDGQRKYDRNVSYPKPFDRVTFQLFPGSYNLKCPPDRHTSFTPCVHLNVTIKRGGIYAILPHVVSNGVEYHQIFKIFTVSNPAVYSFYLMLPQIITQAFAVAMGKIPINLFLFKESPRETLVSTLALYYFSQDGSSIIFAIFNEVFRFRVDSFQLVLLTGIHMVFCFFFTFAALKHQTFPEDDGIPRRRAVMRFDTASAVSSIVH